MKSFSSIMFYVVLFSFSLAACGATSGTMIHEVDPDQMDDQGSSATTTTAPDQVKSTSEKDTVLKKKVDDCDPAFDGLCHQKEIIIDGKTIFKDKVIHKDDSLSPWWIVAGALILVGGGAAICAAADCFDTTTNVEFR